MLILLVDESNFELLSDFIKIHNIYDKISEANVDAINKIHRSLEHLLLDNKYNNYGLSHLKI